MHFKQSGLSIVEFMIAMAVGLMLLLGITQIFTTNSQTMRLQNQTAHVQENARIAVALMGRAIQSADFWGCAGNLADGNVYNHLNPFGAGYDDYMHGYGDGIDTINDDSDANEIIDQTDAIILRGANSLGGVKVDGDAFNINSAQFKVLNNDATLPFEDGDVLLLSDCSAGDLFQVTAKNDSSGMVNHNTGNSESPGNANLPGAAAICSGGNGHCLSQAYDENAFVMLPYTHQYYVGEGASGNNALFLKDQSNNTYELVDNVDNLQMQYGVDTDDDGIVDSYRVGTDAAIPNKSLIKSVRFAFVIKTEEQVATTSNSYTALDKTVSAADRYLRRVYIQTVAVRNRI